jgi:bZIP factor
LELARATHESQQKFAEFRQTLMRQIQSSQPEPKPRSAESTPPAAGSDAGDKDVAYWERRRKNNEAAKRSRDARRAKEQEIALRAQFLEQENIQLKLEIAHLRAENGQLRRQCASQLKN